MEVINMIIDIESSAMKIKGFLGKSTFAILDVGRELERLEKQKKNLKGSQKDQATLEIETMYKDHLPFGKEVGNKFRAISNDRVICSFAKQLPSSYTTLYELRNLTKENMQWLIEKGLNPTSTHGEVVAWKVILFPDDKKDDGVKVKSEEPKTRKMTELKQSETSEDKSEKSEPSTGGVEKSSADTQTSSADSKKDSEQSTKTESKSDTTPTMVDDYWRLAIVKFDKMKMTDWRVRKDLMRLVDDIEELISKSKVKDMIEVFRNDLPQAPELPNGKVDVKEAKEVYKNTTTKKVA